MRLRFTPDAVADLDDLKAWLKSRSPQGYQHVVQALAATIRQIRDHPEAGRSTERPDVREAVEHRYGYIIPYSVRRNTLWILRVYSARRYPLNHTRMTPPENDG